MWNGVASLQFVAILLQKQHVFITRIEIDFTHIVYFG